MILSFSARARINLNDIHDWIARDNPARAISFIDELETACQRLLDAPNGYPPLRGERRRGLRKKAFGNYKIVFAVARDEITIVAVVHGARNIDALKF